MTNPSDMYRRNIKSRVDKPPFATNPSPPASVHSTFLKFSMEWKFGLHIVYIFK